MADQNQTQTQAQSQGQPQMDPNQNVETNAYVPTYKVDPKLKDDVLGAIGDRPFNEIAQLINAINVKEMDHNTLQKVVNALGSFSYNKVAKIITNINSYVEPKVED